MQIDRPQAYEMRAYSHNLCRQAYFEVESSRHCKHNAHPLNLKGRGGRAVECTGLENQQGLIALRGFKSHPLRQIKKRPLYGAFFLFSGEGVEFDPTGSTKSHSDFGHTKCAPKGRVNPTTQLPVLLQIACPSAQADYPVDSVLFRNLAA